MKNKNKKGILYNLIYAAINILIIAAVAMLFYYIDLSQFVVNTKVIVNIILCVLELVFIGCIVVCNGIGKKTVMFLSDVCTAALIEVNELYSGAWIFSAVNYMKLHIIACSMIVLVLVIITLSVIAAKIPNGNISDKTSGATTIPNTNPQQSRGDSDEGHSPPAGEDGTFGEGQHDDSQDNNVVYHREVPRKSAFNIKDFIWNIVFSMILSCVFIAAFYFSIKLINAEVDIKQIKHTLFLSVLIILTLFMICIIANSVYKTFKNDHDSNRNANEEIKQNTEYIMRPICLLLSIAISLMLADNEQFDPISFIAAGKDNVYLQMVILAIFIYMFTFVLYTLFIKSFKQKNEYLNKAGAILDSIIRWIFDLIELVVDYIKFIPEYFKAINVLLLKEECEEEDENDSDTDDSVTA